MLNTSLQCLSRGKESFRKLLSERIKNSVQVKTSKVLSIKLDLIHVQLQETDPFSASFAQYIAQEVINQSSNK